jgi:DNA invertase Pin-like site-specific DNA recombinase
LVSLSQQIEALRAYAAREGYEVLEEARDPGQSEASLEHPGMDRVQDPVAAGGVYAMSAQDGDRFARGSAYLFYLREEFAEHSMALSTLNDRGDGPAALLTCPFCHNPTLQHYRLPSVTTNVTRERSK